MPRGVTVNLASNSETSEKNPSEDVQQCAAVKTESECKGPGEQVIHRKSARRRVARDIFLVFEEQPRRGGRGCNRKRNQLKPKFGHLKVENPNASSRSRNCLLRDIKNEPKCYLNPVGVNSNRTQQQDLPSTRKKVASSTATEKKKKNSVASKTKSAATVNPIFLWAKQDDTRIIEVRCEDYDKRNRIRITKTTTGWRAIPRSDASTSRIVKFFQTPSSLMKLKRELYDSKLLEHNNECTVPPPADFFSNSSNEAINFAGATDDSHQSHVDSDANEAQSKLDVGQEPENNNDEENSNSCSCGVSRGDKLANLQQEECSRSINSPDQLSENESQNCYMSDGAKDSETITTNSDTYQTYSSELRLCPKTGLFFSRASKDPESNGAEANDSGIHIDITQCQLDTENAPSVDSVIESLNTDATNLKDLLDDADLLQHCNVNVNCDAELIDSLVKHGCETSLISETEILKTATCVTEFHKPNTSISSPKDSIDEGIVDNMPPQMMDTVPEPHKCLSFNEAGEIEEESGELFQALQKFSNAFEREPIEETNTLNPKAIETINMPLRNATSLDEGALSLNAVESTPKDLSYRKPEAVCGQSESHSQCAVTSSSDILQSPRQDEVPIVESGTENIKNFILEQFINLNALNSLPNTTTKKQQQEPIDLGQRKKKDIISSELDAPTTKFIETVVIDDNSSDEPVKKKVCNNMEKKAVSNVPSIPVLTNIDGDPDPLTQLQLLLRNTQWKVPDPILVPKDRLGAVLASPAREIPLLITTRPELRLPEAFAYPHIIQNPNILVISMAQLEAILKNEMGMEKTSMQKETGDEVLPIKNIQMATKPQPKDMNTKCSFVDSNSMATDINTATLAVINQMLWLPYIGQWSQEFLSTLKSPIGLQNQFTNFLSPFNHIPFGLQHLDDIYKAYIKQISNPNVHQSDGEIPNFQTSPIYLRAINAFQNHVDLMLLQKLVQQQAPNFPNSDQPSSSSSLSKKDQEPVAHLPESTLNTLHKQHLHTLKHQKCTKESLNLNSTKLYTADYNNIGDMLNKSVDAQKISSYKPTADYEQKKQIIKTKPRLTCKSLSNLLEPESRNLRAIPLKNLTSEIHENERFFNFPPEGCMQQPVSNFTTGTFKQADSISADIGNSRQCSVTNEKLQITSDKASDLTNVQGNTTLTHPLFNSNMNGAYNSQWNWTTVTATGE